MDGKMNQRRFWPVAAAGALLTPLNVTVAAIIILGAVLIFIIWRRRNRRKNRGNSVYLFH